MSNPIYADQLEMISLPFPWEIRQGQQPHVPALLVGCFLGGIRVTAGASALALRGTSKILNLFGKEDLSESVNQTSSSLLSFAARNITRDLAIVGGVWMGSGLNLEVKGFQDWNVYRENRDWIWGLRHPFMEPFSKAYIGLIKHILQNIPVLMTLLPLAYSIGDARIVRRVIELNLENPNRRIISWTRLSWDLSNIRGVVLP